MFRTFAIVTLLLISARPVLAEPPVEALSTCLADHTSGRDRKDLARWVFLAMAAHPEIRQFASEDVTQATEDAHKVVAATFTRLLTESCATEAAAAVEHGGSVAIEAAFRVLGQLAMQELMSDADVNAAMGAFEKYLDQEKLSEVFGKE